MATVTQRTCKAKNRRGERCGKRPVTDGLCLVHSGGQDMKALGRAGGKARHGIKPERVHRGLREYLRAEVDPAEVWQALKLAMQGQNESARVSASRVLMDALAEPHEERDRSADIQRQAAEARQHIADALERRARNRRADPLAALEELIEELRTEAVRIHPDLVVGDVGAERAKQTIEGLERLGLLVPRSKVQAIAEQLAQERLQALKAEHGLSRSPA